MSLSKASKFATLLPPSDSWILLHVAEICPTFVLMSFFTCRDHLGSGWSGMVERGAGPCREKNMEKQLLGGRRFFDSLFESGLHSKILATGILLEVVQVAFDLSNVWWISQMQQLKRPTVEIFLHPTLATFARATAKRSLPDMLRTPCLTEDKTYTTLVQEQLT